MTVFYFQVRAGDDSIEDYDGLVFPSLAAARKAAIAGARDILAEDVKNGLFDINRRFEVFDATDTLCLIIPFTEAVEVVAPTMEPHPTLDRQRTDSLAA